jgi:hypothetical protein
MYLCYSGENESIREKIVGEEIDMSGWPVRGGPRGHERGQLSPQVGT